MARKIYWLSESMGPLQRQAVIELHGTDVEMVEDRTQFANSEALISYILEKGSDFVYVLEHACSPKIIAVASQTSGLTFGVAVSTYWDVPRPTTHLMWLNWPKRRDASIVWPNTARALSRN